MCGWLYDTGLPEQAENNIADMTEVAIVRCNGTYDGNFVFVGERNNKIFVICGQNLGQGSSFPKRHYEVQSVRQYDSLYDVNLCESIGQQFFRILTAIMTVQTLDLDYWPQGIDARVNKDYFPEWIGPTERDNYHSGGSGRLGELKAVSGWRPAFERIHSEEGV